MTSKIRLALSFVVLSMFSVSTYAQCTEANDADMAKYKRLTETQDAQGCSECALLAMYFCSATYTTDPTAKREVGYRINSIKKVIRDMGQPICCQPLLDKQPAWGVAASTDSPNKRNADVVNSVAKGMEGADLSGVDAKTAANVAAAGVAAGIIANEIQQGKVEQAKWDKFKAEYTQLAKLSGEAVNNESDENLGRALAGSHLGVVPDQMVTPIYQYDFNNGGSLKVEGGILKFLHPGKGISKNLILVDKANYGDMKSKNDQATSVLIAPDESSFYLRSYVPRKGFESCSDCLARSDDMSSGYLINASTGEVAASGWPGPADLGRIYFSNGTPEFHSLHYSMKSLLYVKNILFNGGNRKDYFGGTPANKERLQDKGFDFQLGEASFREIWNDDNFHRGTFYREFIIENNSNKVFLNWMTRWINSSADGLVAKASSFIDLSNPSGAFNSDGMTNELTGLAMRNNGDLFFSDKNGRIGKLAASEYKLDDPDLPSKIRAAMTKSVLGGYDFNLRKYSSVHGTRQVLGYESPPDPNNRNMEGYELVPQFQFTPDEGKVIYVVKDSLFLVDPENFNDTKRFGLTVQPYKTFFTRENGEWMLNIMAFNDYVFPVVKKYSLSKLSHADTGRKPKPKAQPVVPRQASEKNAPISVADELKKLKELLDQGVLTQEEFNTAKKKLLEKN